MGGTLLGGYPAGGYPARVGTLPVGGTQSGQQKEYSLHGGRYASCVHAGGLSCWQATRCFCGNNYGRYKAMDETQCSGDANTCGGDLKGFCGAADRSAVYDTFLADLSSCSSSKNFN